MFLTGLGTSVPPRAFSQAECWEALNARRDGASHLSPRSRALLRKVLLGKNGIERRHLVFADLSEAFDLSPEPLHARFTTHAPRLATEAALRALNQAGRLPGEVDAVIVSTCTGYLCPGLTSHVAERLGLKVDVLALDLVGQGCGAAVPNWRTARALIEGSQCRTVLSVCVEVCSAAFYLDDDPGVLISACLFGDSAGAAIFSREPNERVRRIELKAASSSLVPGNRDLLRFETRNGMLRNLLSPRVPGLSAEESEAVLARVLAGENLDSSRISGWMVHPGGRDVLTAFAARMGLEPGHLCWSAEVLRHFGNLSSASVYFVLQRALAGGAPGGFWWVASFGAGFSAHGALLKVE